MTAEGEECRADEAAECVPTKRLMKGMAPEKVVRKKIRPPKGPYLSA